MSIPQQSSGVVYTEETPGIWHSFLERKSVQYGHPIYIIADEPLPGAGVRRRQRCPSFCLYKNTIVCYPILSPVPARRAHRLCGVPSFAEDSTAVYATCFRRGTGHGPCVPPTLIQKVVGLCAQEQPDLQAYDENRTLLYDSLRAMGYECAKPDGAFV